ncbi:hypothetical protein VN97_g11942 [Penicillium thymicola]|uniref:Uncharacterized protein n=1 Tax=Penicillium thymicola TaxID=293382 RepID=A0AAI9T790_PENTH|nr:hypothetical protein VN97_g11942 [Penicillium thymicola]
MHRGIVVIPKSEHEDRALENLQAQHVRFADDDFQAINAYDRKTRFNNSSDIWGISDIETMEAEGFYMTEIIRGTGTLRRVWIMAVNVYCLQP